MMSALRQKRTLPTIRDMSALIPKADISRLKRRVTKGQKRTFRQANNNPTTHATIGW
jgi:hypothetical protein